MFDNIFTISLFDIITWITFGFIVGIIVHSIKPLPSTNAVKDIILAILGSMVAGLTIVFFYGYPLLGILTVSIVGGIILSGAYIWFMHRHPLNHTINQLPSPQRKLLHA